VTVYTKGVRQSVMLCDGNGTNIVQDNIQFGQNSGQVLEFLGRTQAFTSVLAQ
jgi:hypothetical protein